MKYAWLLTALFALLAAPAPASEPAAPQLTSEQWREDLRFMAAEMKARHANLYHHVSKSDFDAAVADLDQRIPQLQRNQIIVGMMRIAAMVGDGHTRVEPRKDKAFRFRSLPLKLYWFEDGIYVRAAAPAYSGLVGARIEKVGGVPVAEAIRRTTQIVSRETESGPRLFVPIYLGMPDILQAVGLSDSREYATFTISKAGASRTVRVAASEFAPLWPADTDISLVTPDGWADAHPGSPPLWLQAPRDFHRLVPLPESHAVYAQLNMVTDTKDETLTGFGDRILAQVRASNPRAVILDLRLDQGGNGDLRNGFIADLIRAEDEDTRLFVLTGRGTFSATQFILDDFARLTHAVFIGEPASSRPTSYGDGYKSLMPNSGIAVRSSIKYWQSGQDMRPYTPIDIAAPLRFADYAAARDPALDAALRYTPGESLADMLAKADVAGGPKAAASAARAYADDPLRRYADIPGELTDAEQVLLANGHAAAALEVARWSVGRYPRDADLATLYAFAADAKGDRSELRQAVEAALRIDPNNRSVQSLKESLGAK